MKHPIALDSGFPPVLVPIAAALIALMLFTSPSQAQAPATYVIPAGDGYGVDECVAKSYECGRVVAGAWCEAHGHGVVKAFGRASDATFSTAVLTPMHQNVKAPSPDSIVISCGE